MLHFSDRLRRFSTALLVCCALSGCATISANPDPLEPVNRVTYRFNEVMDGWIVKPLATAYRFWLPDFVQTGVSNFFSNIGDVLIALNNALQGKFSDAASDVGRVVINTTAGLLGFIDVASKSGLEKHDEDFGQTLGRWGFGPGPYIVLPFLGPSTLRDAVGWYGDIKTYPLEYFDSVSARNAMIGTRVVSRRADLLEASKILDTAALDPYAFVRDGFLQRRLNQVYDGNPPREKFDDDEPADKPAADKPAAKPEPEKKSSAPAADQNVQAVAEPVLAVAAAGGE